MKIDFFHVYCPKAPVASGAWNGVFNASDFGPGCIQVGNPGVPKSEDCLFLNVFVPDPAICNCSTKIPVIIYIYGGGFTGGVSTAYRGELIMKKCVILVTFNYRLGAFGFLPLALPEYSGNMGLKDQLLALKWVSDNISAFGGNPKQITLMGESAGGISVGLHKLNPTSRRLFKQAYILSGPILHSAMITSNNRTFLMVEAARSINVTIENQTQLINFIKTIDANYATSFPASTSTLTFLNLTWGPCIECEYFKLKFSKLFDAWLDFGHIFINN